MVASPRVVLNEVRNLIPHVILNELKYLTPMSF